MKVQLIREPGDDVHTLVAAVIATRSLDREIEVMAGRLKKRSWPWVLRFGTRSSAGLTRAMNALSVAPDQSFERVIEAERDGYGYAQIVKTKGVGRKTGRLVSRVLRDLITEIEERVGS